MSCIARPRAFVAAELPALLRYMTIKTMTEAAIETWPAEGVMPAAPDGPLYFDAILAPNRSLPGAGFLVLMAVLVGISFASGIAFFLIGAWPIPFFFGIDVALVWLAFRISYRDGRQREIIRVTRDRVLVHRRYPNGGVRHYQMPTAWTRAELAGRGTHGVQFSLRAHGKALVLGAFLSREERESLADATAAALARAKRGAPAQEAGGAA